MGDATAHSYHGIAYARYSAPRWYANALLSVGGDVEAGYKLTFGKTVLTPAVGLSYDRLNRDDLQESGSAAVALTLDKDYRRSLVGRAGARLSTSYTAQGTTLIPYVSAFVTQELSDRSSVITPTLHDARFVVTAPEAGRTNARLAAGVTALLSPAVALRFGYRYSNAGGYSSNAVSGGVSLRW